jgi:hypothetical protein
MARFDNCFFALVVLLLNLCCRQAIQLKMKELLPLQERWRRTQACTPLISLVRLFFSFEYCIRSSLVVCFHCGRLVRCIVCVTVEPPPSLDNSFGAEGAAALAAALGKNTSLHTLKLNCEFVFGFQRATLIAVF